MEQSSHRVAELSDKILHLMRQWGTATIAELETQLPGIERRVLEAAMQRLVDLKRVKQADKAGTYRPR